jgi:peptidylprolyl isomerase
MNQEAKKGDRVRIRYTGYLENGTLFDATYNTMPLELELGSNQAIPGIENAVIGMKTGDVRTVNLEPEEAFGHPREDLVARVEREKLPEGVEPSVGMPLEAQSPEGETLAVRVTGVDEETITVDANHPFAGKNLKYEIRLMEIL